MSHQIDELLIKNTWRIRFLLSHPQQLALFFTIALLVVGLLMIIAYFSSAQEVTRELKFY